MRSPRLRQRHGSEMHIVDRAREYFHLHQQYGWDAQELSLRHGRSKGYGSIVLRVGRAVGPLSDVELSLFRSPRVTLLEISRRLRRDMDEGAVLRMLLSLTLNPVPDGRRRRGGHSLPPTLRPKRRPAGEHGWSWDETAAAQDPVAVVLEWIEHVRASQQELSARMRELLASRSLGKASLLAGHGLLRLAAAVQRQPGSDHQAEDARVRSALRDLEQWIKMADEIRRPLAGAPPTVIASVAEGGDPPHHWPAPKAASAPQG